MLVDMPLMDSLIVFCATYLLWVEVIAFIIFVAMARRRVRVRLVLISAIALPLSYLFGRLAGHLWYDTRPFVDSGVTPLLSYTADNGFPSDHMLLAATLAMIVSLRYPRTSIA